MNKNGFLICSIFLWNTIYASDLDARVARLENVVNNQLNLDTINKIEHLTQEVSALHGLLEEIQHDINRLKIEQAEFTKNLHEQKTNLAKPSKIVEQKIFESDKKKNMSVVGAEENNMANTKQNNSTEKEEYDKTFAIVQTKNYVMAEQALKTYIDKYPTGSYTANAYYWLGEGYHSMWKQDRSNIERLHKAEESFQKVLRAFPENGKAADALLKLSILAEDNQDIAAARAYLLQLLDKYPNTEAATRGKIKLNDFDAS